MTNPIIILGSADSFGETYKAVKIILNGREDIPIVDLNNLDITPFDYKHHNKYDDYLPLMEKILKYDLIVLATPTYWYSMSAQMKIFIDRLSDILSVRRDIKEKLCKKHLFVITTYNVSTIKSFEETFVETCKYMNMVYRGCSFIRSDKYYTNKLDKSILDENTWQIEKAREIITL